MVADAAPAEPFGPYLVYERLGVGGMATVHRALERGIEGFERIVALKRLLPHLAEDASFIKSFVREAKLASLLNHIHIVQIFELGRVGSQYFISMEYIDGRDIRRLLRHARRVTGPPPIHVTVGLLLQLCEALEYAHGKHDEHGHPLGLVHRDVSPSNLLVTRAGHLKVIDFGIAKAQSAQLRTQTGRVKGKLAYMAPEAIAGKDLDCRSDLFSVGVIAHELLTARPLFASKNEYQTLLKVQRGDILPPSTFNQACPAELDAMVLRALARDPNDRFACAAELREQLAALRRAYDLQTGHRDVADWIAWAFSVELPSDGFGTMNTFDQGGSGPARLSAAVAKARAGSSPARREEDEAAIEMAWGGAEGEQAGGPVLLDDVPDVSGKHLGYGPADELEYLDDDIPPTQPSHGLPQARSVGGVPLEPPVRMTMPGHGPEPRLPSMRRSAMQPAVTPGPDDAAEFPGLAGRPSRAVEAQRSRTPSGAIREPEAAEIGVGTMRDLPPVSAGRVRARADSVAPRELPSLEPHLMDEAAAAARAAAEAVAAHGEEEPDLLATARRPRKRREGNVTIGSAIAARRPSRGPWVLLAMLLVAGGAAAAFTMFGRGGDGEQAPMATVQEPTTPQQPARTAGTVKFVIVPEDAEILIEGQPSHRGSPWDVELPAGVHQISIQRSGFKAWLTSVELSPNESQLFRVVLEPLGGTTAPAEATLSLSTTPQGLEVVLDGQPLPQRTPIRVSIKPGRHMIILRQGGAEVWRQEVDAKPSVDYEFTPSMTEDKQRERAERASVGPARPGARATITSVDRGRGPRPDEGSRSEDKAPNRTIESPSVPSISAITPEPPPARPTAPTVPSTTPTAPQATPTAPQATPTAPQATPTAPSTTPTAPSTTPTRPSTTPTTPTAPPAKPVKPVLIASSAVTRTSGATPSLNMSKLSKYSEVPAVVTVKVCIDTAGRVTTADVITKLDRATATELSSTIKEWTYTPYKHQGTAMPACFAVSFRSK